VIAFDGMLDSRGRFMFVGRELSEDRRLDVDAGGPPRLTLRCSGPGPGPGPGPAGRPHGRCPLLPCGVGGTGSRRH
jgi:hypothetical protein